jgi:hypothetical protein
MFNKNGPVSVVPAGVCTEKEPIVMYPELFAIKLYSKTVRIIESNVLGNFKIWLMEIEEGNDGSLMETRSGVG